MVYCGKASLGCSSCRKRRIKCDRVKPECSQCLRLSKECPGYRDQLSLMFRDETVKVEKKVRASWGLADQTPETPLSSAAESSYSRPATFASSSRQAPIPSPPASTASPASIEARSNSPNFSPPTTLPKPTRTQQDGGSPPSTLTLYSPVGITPAELGVAFYAERYTIGYPDEVKSASDLGNQHWFRQPLSQDIMAATGLAALANLNDDKQLQHLSMEKYSHSLIRTGEALQDSTYSNIDVTIRTVVMLALFQCVHLSHESHNMVRAHIMGCTALISNAIPMHQAPAHAIFGVLQLCYSLFIPCVFSGLSLPTQFYDSVELSKSFLPSNEQPAAGLILIIAEVTQMNATIRTKSFIDGRTATNDMVRQLLDIDRALNDWEVSQGGKWRYTVFHDDSGLMHPDAVFKGQFHRYSDIWSSRIWGHYRWSRIVLNQMIVEFVKRYPSSSFQLITVAQQDRIYETIRRMATDILTSAPTHYKHPRLNQEQLDAVQSQGGAGIGIVGIPAMLFHLQVAACAPGVTYEIWAWALNILETVWAELGMLHARSLAEALRNHRNQLDQHEADGED